MTIYCRTLYIGIRTVVQYNSFVSSFISPVHQKTKQKWTKRYREQTKWEGSWQLGEKGKGIK